MTSPVIHWLRGDGFTEADPEGDNDYFECGNTSSTYGSRNHARVTCLKCRSSKDFGNKHAK